MIDCLITNLSKISASIILDTLSLNPKNYAVITFHRPSNVDTKDSLEKFLIFFKQLSEQIHLVLPLHPRTKGNIEKYNL
jgi:UDP-N-acetylglucosamine 2-epimerase (non-hydrolysing)